MHARQNICNGIVQALTSDQPRNPQTSTSIGSSSLAPVAEINELSDIITTASTSEVIVEEISVKELGIEWGDFCEEFSITPAHRAQPLNSPLLLVKVLLSQTSNYQRS